MATKNVAPLRSESIDDYLKAILELGGSDEAQVTSNALADHLGVRPASVTGMLQKLAAQRQPFVFYEKHRGVKLTAAGKRRAWELVRHHRLLELFLHDVLKYSWDEVHEEAERLEHFISERFEDRVAALLGDPYMDPHGHSIPQKDELGVFREEILLVDWPLQTPATIVSVSDRDPALLRELERLNIVPQVTLSVEQKKPGTALWVRTRGTDNPIRVRHELALCVSVIAANA